MAKWMHLKGLTKHFTLNSALNKTCRVTPPPTNNGDNYTTQRFT